jgi:hypothetical protein
MSLSLKMINLSFSLNSNWLSVHMHREDLIRKQGRVTSSSNSMPSFTFSWQNKREIWEEGKCPRTLAASRLGESLNWATVEHQDQNPSAGPTEPHSSTLGCRKEPGARLPELELLLWMKRGSKKQEGPGGRCRGELAGPGGVAGSAAPLRAGGPGMGRSAARRQVCRWGRALSAPWCWSSCDADRGGALLLPASWRGSEARGACSLQARGGKDGVSSSNATPIPREGDAGEGRQTS